MSDPAMASSAARRLALHVAPQVLEPTPPARVVRSSALPLALPPALPLAAVPRIEEPPRNRLLSALSSDVLELLTLHLELVELEQHAGLFSPEQPIRHVYFPESAVVSLVSRLQDGRTVEVATTGHEGVAGLSVFLSGDTSTLEAFAQISGLAYRMESSAFVRLAEGSAPLRRVLLRYSDALLSQIAQTAACNGAHVVEERCARWLLMTADRVGADEFPITHESLAFMLGVRRAGVTVSLRALQDAGLVAYARGRISILDRVALEAVSCECYRVVRAHFDRLLPQHARG